MRVGCLILAWLFAMATSFYLPGVAPREWLDGEDIPVKVNSIKSIKTAIPYDYYSIMHCRPETPHGVKVKAEATNMGEILWGDSIKPSRYVVHMRKDLTCQKVCTTKPKSDFERKTGISKPLKKLKRRIDDEYRGNLVLDNLPIAEVYIWEGGERGLYYRRGYPLGTPGNKTHPTLVNNHLAMTIKYHKPEGLPGYRIVGFEVMAYSVSSEKIDSDCNPAKDFDAESYPPQTVVLQPADRATKMLSWSYSVHWIEDREVAWSSRWDHYLKSSDASASNIHWFAIINSLMIVLCLTGMVAMILLRALHKDFNRYNNPENEEEAQEETGWKVIHSEVFREPPYSSLLAVYVGTGCQLLGCSFATLLFALLGFLSPARRGGLMTTLLVLFALMGLLGGYVTAILAKMFHRQSWNTVFLTGLWLPGQVFAVFFLMDLMLWGMQAANAVPFLTLLGLIALWFFVSLPLTCFGGALGYKQATITHPQGVSQIPRFIPEQKWHMQAPVMVLCAGSVPFGAAFIELYFILSSLWLNKFYYVFGFLAVVYVILLVTCAEISIVLVYFQLCYEDYRWWWRGFLCSASCGVYLFLYGIYYWATNLNITKPASLMLYFGYMAVMSYGLAIMAGAVGFLASWVFVRYIYAALKVD